MGPGPRAVMGNSWSALGPDLVHQSLACIVLLPGFVCRHKHLMQAAWCTVDAACPTRRGARHYEGALVGWLFGPPAVPSGRSVPRMVGPLEL